MRPCPCDMMLDTAMSVKAPKVTISMRLAPEVMLGYGEHDNGNVITHIWRFRRRWRVFRCAMVPIWWWL
ncbi:hypothetical protein A2U01_0014407, partial [Trifolium medium]|nr:hypothetical protein [Trifolium medium]